MLKAGSSRSIADWISVNDERNSMAPEHKIRLFQIACTKWLGLRHFGVGQSQGRPGSIFHTLGKNGSPGRIRTYDRSINSRLLYR
jgi:hypothetical protein